MKTKTTTTTEKRKPTASPPRPTINHIEQANGYDCGVAVAAMLANVTLDDALAALPERHPLRHKPRYGIQLSETRRLLLALTSRHYVANDLRGLNTTLFDHAINLPCTIGAIFIRPDTQRWGHWVAFDRTSPQAIKDASYTAIYDPESPDGALLLGYYSRDDWKMICELTTADRLPSPTPPPPLARLRGVNHRFKLQTINAKLNYQPTSEVYASRSNGYWYVIERNAPTSGALTRAVKAYYINEQFPQRAEKKARDLVAYLNSR